jgi:hypothetical protein
MVMSQDEHDAIERLLSQVHVQQPSAALDARMELLLRPRIGWMTGPALGFAAGVLVTVGVMFGVSRAHTQSVATMQTHDVSQAPTQLALGTQQTQSSSDQTPATADVWGVPYQQVSQMDGEIDGVPVRIEQTQQQVDVWQSGQSGNQYVTSVNLPGEVTVSPIATY